MPGGPKLGQWPWALEKGPVGWESVSGKRAHLLGLGVLLG